jgi:hypothetical protein
MNERWSGTVAEPPTREQEGRAPTEAAEPTRSIEPTPIPPRVGCDPAYPEARTCIPPGPPFNQGCAITDERNFTVLPPDPQGLDRDKNGTGCKPIGSS